MENRDNQTGTTGQDTDLTKGQNSQQSPQDPQRTETQGQQGQQGQNPDFGQDRQSPETGQADYGSAGQSDTATQQRSDIEGGTSTGQATDPDSDVDGSAAFVGSQGSTDMSGDLIEDDESGDDFAKDGQGAAE